MNCNNNTMPLIEVGSQTTCNNGCTPKDINVVCRKIIIPTGQEILGVQGDTGSISRTFVVPKTTEEGYDLSSKVFRIIVENGEGEQWEETIPVENIETLENYIKLKWNLIPKDTQYSGELKVSIKAIKDNFIWQTYIASFEIQPSLIQPEDIRVPLNLQDKTVEPNDKVQVITYDEGYDGLNSVTVDGSEDLQPENIVVGKTIFNVEGTFSADGNATASDLLKDKIAYANGEKIIGTLDMPKITDASYFFQNGRRLDANHNAEYYAPLFGEITTTLYMFSGIRTSKADINLIGFDTSKCTNMSDMFYQCAVPVINLKGLDTSNVKDMTGMFSSCSGVSSLDFSGFNTSNVTNMTSMFSTMNNLVSLDLSSFDTSNVTSMSGMFSGRSGYEVLNLSNFNTTKVTDMGLMFSNNDKITFLDLSSFDTNNVTIMSSIFGGCIALEKINFGENFNTSKVKNMSYMFNVARKLKELPQLQGDVATNIQYICYEMSLLESFGGILNLGKGYSQKTNNYVYYTLNLSGSNRLTHDSLMNVINGLYDLNLTYDVAGGGTLYTQTLRLGTTNIAKLTEEEIAIATDKGWNVA